MTTWCKDVAAVEFRFFRPAARAVLLAGDFTDDWSQRFPMRREPYGWWTLRLALAPGEYRFRYVADGQWYTDFASNGVEFTTHGWNSVLVVPGEPVLSHPPHGDEVGDLGDSDSEDLDEVLVA